MRSLLLRIGLIMGLILFSSCKSPVDNKVSKKTSQFTVDSTFDLVEIIYNKSKRNYYTQFTPIGTISTYTTIIDSNKLVITKGLGIITDTVLLSEKISSKKHHFFGDLNSAIIYSTSLNYSDDEPDCIYKVNLESGKVEKDFMEYKERFGRSLINQYARNDTFFLSFEYPYINSKEDNAPGVWDVSHIGMGYLKSDTIKFIKAFGYQRPKLAEEFVWKHPKVYYVPNRNEVLFSYYWSDEVLVYDFKGDLIRKVKVPVDGYDKTKFYGNSYKPGCFGEGEWDIYMADSVLHFSQIGFSEKEQLYFRTVCFAKNDSRGSSGFVFFNEKGEIVKTLSGFNDNYGNMSLDTNCVYAWDKSYDSLHYRISNFFKYNYPEGW